MNNLRFILWLVNTPYHILSLVCMYPCKLRVSPAVNAGHIVVHTLFAHYRYSLHSE